MASTSIVPRRRAVLAAAAALAGAACVARMADATAQAPEAAAPLRLSVAVGPALPLGKGAQRWGELLREGGDAAIATRLHPGASLAGRDAARELAALADGRADLAVGSSLAWSLQVPALGVFSLPWFAPDDAQLASLAADAELLALLASRFAAAGATLVAVGPLGHRAIATTATTLRAPEDLAGLRLRTVPTPLLQEVLLALGARPQTLAFAQVQAALEGGALDGLEGAPTSLAAARPLAGSQRHLTDLRGVGEAMVFAVRTAVWDAWTPAQRTLAREAAERAIRETDAPQREQAALRQMAAQGTAVLRLTAAGQRAFRDATAPVAARWRGAIGDDVVARAERVLAPPAPAAGDAAVSPSPVAPSAAPSPDAPAARP